MNRVSSTSQIITVDSDIFVLTQILHWVAMLGWGFVTAGILVKPCECQHVLRLVSGLTELIVGLPLAFVTAQELGRFSLIALAPIISLILVVIVEEMDAFPGSNRIISSFLCGFVGSKMNGADCAIHFL